MELREKQVQEAAWVIGRLGLPESVYDELKQGKLTCSTLLGTYQVSEENYLGVVRDFEQRYNALVYYVIYSNTGVGEMLSLMYVSAHEEEWEMERNAVSEEYPFAYVVNITCPEFSEFGYIETEIHAGRAIRVG